MPKFPDRLPVLPVADLVVFPYMVIPLGIGRERSIRAVEAAMGTGRSIIVTAQTRLSAEDPGPEDLYRVGTVAEILQLLKLADNTLKILIHARTRVRLEDVTVDEEKKFITAGVSELASAPSGQEGGEAINLELEALMRRARELFEDYSRLSRRVPADAVSSVHQLNEPDKLADSIAAHIMRPVPERQAMLEAVDPRERLELVVKTLGRENEILSLERKIHSRVRTQIEKTQKEYYLTEQMKAIQKELRQKDETLREFDETRAQIKSARMPKEAEEAAKKELARLEKTMPFTPEATVIRTYLDWLTHLPWAVRTTDNLEIARAEKILDGDHYGLEKAKERILEYLAVCRLAGKIKGPILCFVGPPGVGKTSLARSVARAIDRNFVRLSLGGVRDEAEIRGHRRTYIGALPGRIIQSLRKAKSRNPVFLLDEVDKMGSDFRGDPAAALLEVLDPEQNHAFSDHYLEVDFDLSDVLFIATANTLHGIHPTLQDRLEIIRFPGYTGREKMEIARQFLVPKQLKDHGLDDKALNLSAETLQKMIRDYTEEAGVRNLNREIANLCRKVARRRAEAIPVPAADAASPSGTAPEGKSLPVHVTPRNLEKFLGVARFHHDQPSENETGVATGLAWTEAGGDTLAIEVSLMPGKGLLTLTGKLGEVMQESARAALTYVRSNAARLGVPPKFHKERDIHIHVPEGAIPKDGPSAGVTMAVALTSALSGRPVKKDIAMTGEITLRGRVLSVGGIKEKSLAAHREGVRIVLFPVENRPDVDELPAEIRKQITFIPIKTIDEALALALVDRPSRAGRGRGFGRPASGSRSVDRPLGPPMPAPSPL